MKYVFPNYDIILNIGNYPSAYNLLKHKTTGNYLVIQFPLALIADDPEYAEASVEEYLEPYTKSFKTAVECSEYISRLQVSCSGTNIYDCPSCNHAFEQYFKKPAALYLANPDSYNVIMNL